MPPACRYLAAIALFLLPSASPAADRVDFARDIRPILSNSCYKCHGPAVQKAKLRLDKSNTSIEPGKPDESLLIERICDLDDGARMPPPKSGKRLKPDQIAKLKAWIAQGAKYPKHWSFVPVQRPAVPEVHAVQGRAGNEIDAFIQRTLESNGLSLSPEASKATLIRRVSLDLTGLLPGPKEVEEFIKDQSSGAYEKVVDRLLASPHYGERQARHWLDLARYADSNGYTIDGARSIWPYRDWVIKALNDDMPFDQFTAWQLAGDLLPKATLEQKIATGFHRNTSFNEEGGTDPEQFRVERTIDRTNTTGAVWLGLTVGCCQCHDHKYDPLTQKDYYRLYAFFDSCDEPTTPVGGNPRIGQTIAKLNQMEYWIQKNGGSREDIARIRKEVKRVKGGVPTTLTLRERPTPRQTHVQLRGDFLRQGEPVQPGFPGILEASAKLPGKRLSRLRLAQWLTSRDNPLTARVTVNREWQKFFGKGLVDTENDFGIQGSFPTHPQLLDWLAAEFMEKNWSFKRLHKLIVMSAAYRQASTGRADSAKVDPSNKLLARQNRLRLEAESIRDVALVASGLLCEKVGGPGVFPPQAKEVFLFTQSRHQWKESKGPDRYRRGMYTYIWRQSQHPLLTTFDASDAQTTCTRRNRSNTPLQALHLANDPVFVELAGAMGKRIARDGPPSNLGKVRFAFQVCFSREPSNAEADRVLKYYESQKSWAAVARVLMNLDEFITRE